MEDKKGNLSGRSRCPGGCFIRQKGLHTSMTHDQSDLKGNNSRQGRRSFQRFIKPEGPSKKKGHHKYKGQGHEGPLKSEDQRHSDVGYVALFNPSFPVILSGTFQVDF